MARSFFERVRALGEWQELISDEPFSVDGSLIEAWASHKRFQPRDPKQRQPPIGGGRNAEADSGAAMPPMPRSELPAIVLSKLNFEALAQRFKQSRHKNTHLQALKAAIRAKLDRYLSLNRTHSDFAEKFEALIESYNYGSRNIEPLFEELLKLSNSPDDEQQGHVRENLREEELVIFDILTRPAPPLTTAERDGVQKVAKALLSRLKTLLVLNWRQKSAARSSLKMAIEDIRNECRISVDQLRMISKFSVSSVRSCGT